MASAEERTKRNKRERANLFKSIRRAKSWCDNALDYTIAFRFTHEQELQTFGKLRQTDWWKRLPRWAKSEVEGYEAAIRRSKYSPLSKVLRMGHLYEGKIYRDYNHWRKSFPEVNGSALTDSVVSYWPVELEGKAHGKVHFAGLTDEQKEIQGKCYPIAVE